jgi:hypothetical protein
MRRALFLAPFCAFLGLLAPAASAYPFSVNWRLDRALHRGHEPPDIVAGRIARVRLQTPKAEWEGLEIQGVDLEVTSAVLGGRDLEGKTLPLDTSAFEWPEVLVKPEAGARCIVVLDREEEEGATTYDIETVVPARERAFERAADAEGAKRTLAGEILAALAAEREPGRQRQLILLAAPILTAGEATALEPFLGSEDAWLRRAALAGLCHATRRPGFVEFAALDIRRFLETTGPRDMVKDPEEEGISWAPYPRLFDHYFFLDTGWSEEDYVPDYLPLWRLVAVGLRGDELARYRYGIAPLCRGGTDGDIPFLLRYREALEQGDGELKQMRDNPRVRQETLLGLARILGLDLPNYVEQDFVRHEAEQVKQVTAALEARDAAKAGAGR